MGKLEMISYESKSVATTRKMQVYTPPGYSKESKYPVPDPAQAKEKLKLLWLACGKKDDLIRISQGVHAYLKEKNVPHIWHVDGNGHDPTEWKNNLYLFCQHIFR